MFFKSSQFSQNFQNRASSSLKSAATPCQSVISSAVRSLTLQPASFNFNYFIRDTVCVFVYVIVRTVNNIGVFDYGTKGQPQSIEAITSTDVQSLYRAGSIQTLNIVEVDKNEDVIQEVTCTKEPEDTTLDDSIYPEVVKSSLRKVSSSTISSDEGIHSAHEHELDEIEEIRKESIEEDKEDKLEKKPIYMSTMDLTQGQKKLMLCFMNRSYFDKLKKKFPHKRKPSKEPFPTVSEERSGQPEVQTKPIVSIWSRMIRVFHQNKVDARPVYVKSEPPLNVDK